MGCPKYSTSPNNPAGTTAVLACPLVSTNVPTRNCACPAVCSDVVFVVTLRDRWQRCAFAAFNRGRALLKAVIGLRWLSVAGVSRKLNKKETNIVEPTRNVTAQAQKPELVFLRNGRVHLNRRGGVSSVDYWQSRSADQRAAIVLSLASTLITT